MNPDVRMGILAAAFFMALTAALPVVQAKSAAICNTPMYDGVCCDQTASPTLWPDGNGCCYGGQPYPGPTCPLLQNTPTPSPSSTPTSNPSGSSTPSATPTVNPTINPPVTPTPSQGPSTNPANPPNARPAAFVKLTCPSNLIIGPNITLGTLSLAFGQPACNPAVQLNASTSKNQALDVTNLGCVNGQSAFLVNLTTDGTYAANATFNGSTDSCLFAITGTPPKATPELDPTLIMATALLAALWMNRKAPR